jgi:hypothetical protein
MKEDTLTTTRTAKAKGLARLKTRKLPVAVYHLRAAEPDEEMAAREGVTAADERHTAALMRGDEGAEAAIAKAQAELDQAQAALADCYQEVRIQALEPDEFERLLGLPENKPRKGTDDTLWNNDTFGKAVFLAGVQGELTAEEWVTEVIPQLSQAEKAGLFVKALNINARWTDGSVPKD